MGNAFDTVKCDRVWCAACDDVWDSEVETTPSCEVEWIIHPVANTERRGGMTRRINRFRQPQLSLSGTSLEPLANVPMHTLLYVGACTHAHTRAHTLIQAQGHRYTHRRARLGMCPFTCTHTHGRTDARKHRHARSET